MGLRTGPFWASEKNCRHPDARADFGLRLCEAFDRCLRPSEKICRPSGRNTVKLLCGYGGPPSDPLRVSENFTDHPDDEGLHRADLDSDDGVVLNSGRRSPRSRDSRSGARHRGGRSALVSGLVQCCTQRYILGDMDVLTSGAVHRAPRTCRRSASFGGSTFGSLSRCRIVFLAQPQPTLSLPHLGDAPASNLLPLRVGGD